MARSLSPGYNRNLAGAAAQSAGAPQLTWPFESFPLTDFDVPFRRLVR